MTTLKLDDITVRNLLSNRELWAEFPVFSNYYKEYTTAASNTKGCKCRRNRSPGVISVLEKTRQAICAMSSENKIKLKKALHTDYVTIFSKDANGRTKRITF